MDSEKPNIIVLQSGFPALSATFILDQITGLINRRFNVNNWATYLHKESSIHPDVINFGLDKSTRYLNIPPVQLQRDEDAWLQAFFHRNNNIDLNLIDGFHIHYGLNFNHLKPLFRLLDCFVLVSFHGHDASRAFRNFGDDFYGELYQRADLITAPSEAIKHEIVIRGCDPSRVIIHRCGVDLEQFKPPDKSKPNEVPVLLSVARLVEKKGIKYTLQALAEIKDSVKFKYRIIGDGPLKPELLQLLDKLGLDDYVEFLGARPKDDVIREMQNSDLFILNSVVADDGDREGLPVSLIEAQSMGIPVVSSFHSGIPELVENNKTGLLSEEKDVKTIAAQVKQLLEDVELRKSMSINSRERVKDEFDIEKLNDRLADILFTGIGEKKLQKEQNDSFSLLPDLELQDDPLIAALKSKNWEEKLSLYRNEFRAVDRIKDVVDPVISIIMISWQMNDEIIETVKLLQDQRDLKFEIILVNNGCEPSDFDVVRDYVDILVHLNSNTGAYFARNVGSIFSSAPILLFLDDDALPDNSLLFAHQEAFNKWDVICVRGVVLSKTGNPINQLARHYDLGDKPFPVYANVEGNVSYDARYFFQVNGWDDEIKFGGGGVDLSKRLLMVEPDMRKQIYIPDAVIYHDYAQDNDHLERKRDKQEISRERLKKKHPDWDEFMLRWKIFHLRDDLMLPREKPFGINEASRTDDGNRDKKLQKAASAQQRPFSEDEIREKSNEHIGNARVALQSRKSIEGIRELEKALDLNPVNMEAVFLLRQVEDQAGEAYRTQREERELKLLEHAYGTPRWEHILLRQGAFDNAPRIMAWLKKTMEHHDDTGSDTKSEIKNNPLVSFVIPVYNRARSVKWTFNSVLRQTYANWEIILVDDASTDGKTADVIRNLEKQYPDRKIKSIFLDNNRGIGAVRNIGAEAAEGEFLVFLDSDDTIAPAFLEKTVAAALVNPEYSWVSPLTVQYGEVNRLFGFENFAPNVLVQRNQFNITCLIRKEMYDALGGMREEMKDGFVDWEFWVRALSEGYFPFQVREPLFFYHRHKSGISGGIKEDVEREFHCKQQIIEFNPKIYRRLGRVEAQVLLDSTYIPRELVNWDEMERIGDRWNKLIESGKLEEIQQPEKTLDGDKRKILFVCHDFPPYRYAGAQLYAFHLAQELIRLGNDVSVFYPINRSNLNGSNADVYSLLEGQYEGIRVFQVVVDDMSEDARLNPQFSFNNEEINRVFRGLLREQNFDLVHYHLLFRLGNGLPGVTRAMGIPTVSTLHDYWLLCPMGHMINTYAQVCSGPETPKKCAACLAGVPEPSAPREIVNYSQDRIETNRIAHTQIDRVLAPSQFIADTHSRYGFPVDDIHPLGWLPVQTQNRKPVGDKIIFGYCGQIVYRKGLDIFLRGLMEQENNNWELHIYGRSHEEQYFDSILRSADTIPNIHYLGEYTPEDLPRIFSSIDMAVIPSRRENYPLTLLEALSAKLPVIISNVGGVPEMMTNGKEGFIFENENVDQLSTIIRNILSNPSIVQSMKNQISPIKTISDDAVEMAKIYGEIIETVVV